MKRGASGDPFADADDEQDDVDESDESGRVSEASTGGAERAAVDDTDSTADSSDEIPYVLRRAEVKEGRKDTSFPLRESTRQLEREAAGEIEAAVGADVPLSDVREVAYIVGLQHRDEVVEQLLEWGYEHRR